MSASDWIMEHYLKLRESIQICTLLSTVTGRVACHLAIISIFIVIWSVFSSLSREINRGVVEIRIY